MLLYGPPGTGKTLLARAVAHHTDCTVIRVSGSELVQKYIGEGSRMVRELFVMARYVAAGRVSRRPGRAHAVTAVDGAADPGRIDRKIEFPPPNDAARADILRIHSRRMNMSRDIDLLKIAEKMSGASGAECKVRTAHVVLSGDDSHSRATAKSARGGRGTVCRSRKQGVCTEAGMFALRERRIHVTQEDFEMAVAKVGPLASMRSTRS